MSYEAYYEFTVVSGEGFTPEYFETILEKIVGFNPNHSTTRWDNMRKNMKTLSVMYPNHLFMIESTGIESGDFNRSYFKNNKIASYEGEVTFKPFKMEDLQ